MNRFLSFLIKLSGLPVQHFYFKKKVYYEDNIKQLKKIKGGAIIVSNHKSVYDFPLIMYTFFSRNIRPLVAETMFTHSKSLNNLMKILGAIKVDRKRYDFSFLTKISDCLKNKQVCLIFPESRLHKPEEKVDLLPFAPSYVYLAIKNNVPIIPVYTNGIYGALKKQNKSRAKIIIGKKIFPKQLINDFKTEKENIIYINDYVRNYIINLKKKLLKFK